MGYSGTSNCSIIYQIRQGCRVGDKRQACWLADSYDLADNLAALSIEMLFKERQ